MLANFSYVTTCCVLILEIIMERSIGLEGENICRNLNTNLSRCCKDHEEKLNKCVECRSGYFGLNCSSKCPENYYGRRCSERCDCPIHYYCDHVCGCEPNSTFLNQTKSDRCNRSMKNIENVTEDSAFRWIPIVFIVVGIILCLGVNFLCWRCGLRKGRTTYKFKSRSQKNTKFVRNQQYNEKEGPNANQINNCRNVDKYLRTQGNNPPGQKIQTINKNFPSALENSVNLSAEIRTNEIQMSSSSDSDSYQSVKSKHYQNEQGGYSPETKGLYESITDGRSTYEHHYTDLQP